VPNLVQQLLAGILSDMEVKKKTVRLSKENAVSLIRSSWTKDSYLRVRQRAIEELGKEPLDKQKLQEAITALGAIQFPQNGLGKLKNSVGEAAVWIIKYAEQVIHSRSKEFLCNVRSQWIQGIHIKVQAGRCSYRLQKKSTGLQNIHKVEFKFGAGFPIAANSPGSKNLADERVVSTTSMGN
jgi:hypothetical protein